MSTFIWIIEMMINTPTPTHIYLKNEISISETFKDETKRKDKQINYINKTEFICKNK